MKSTIRTLLFVLCLAFLVACDEPGVQVDPPSLGGVTTAIKTAGDLNTQATVIAKEIHKSGTPAKSVPSAQLVGLLEETKEAHRLALAQVKEKQKEVGELSGNLEKEREVTARLEKALANSTKWHLIFGWGFATFTLAGVIAFFALKNHPYIGWAFKIPLLGRFAEFAGLVVGGLAGALAAFALATILITLWSGFGWFFKLFQ